MVELIKKEIENKYKNNNNKVKVPQPVNLIQKKVLEIIIKIENIKNKKNKGQGIIFFMMKIFNKKKMIVPLMNNQIHII